MWRFDDPWNLILLLIIPIRIFFHQRRQRGALLFSGLQTAKSLPRTGTVSASWGPLLLRSAALLFLIVALARPQSGRTTTEVLTKGIDIMLTLDTSGSMKALDFEIKGKRINRLAVVKKVVAKFIKGREHDRMGMVVFAGNAYTQCPLTLDRGVLLTLLDRVEIGPAGDGTAIGSALATAVKRLKDSKAKSKVVILLTDGRNNTGKIDPETAAELAKNYNIKVYCIGAGTKGPAPFLVDSFFGKRYVYQNVDIDEKTLKMIAATTGGRYFRATDTKGLEAIYKKIDSMEKTKVKVKEYSEYTEEFAWFLIPGLFFLGLEVVLENTFWRKIP
ncbi:MAG: VWA domain-containing protein [Deltaproteobacteria bacterium]|nr:VWA domain-containing protein [Deltaproteobacteria bacterium]